MRTEMVMDQTDTSVIRAALERPAAFAEVFDRHYGAIRDYLARRLPAALAEEVAAETFLVAFERRFDYDLAYPSARPWLFGITTNLLGRHRRDERRRMQAYRRAPPSPIDDGIEDAVARADASLARNALAAAIATLEPGDRDALMLQAVAELTYPEIALALGVPPGTVKSRLNRARRQLSEALAPEGVNASG
ncbi:MAG: sigma-70 family RNA polymerase sigma factor [Acidobacteria bacterium]|nr:MAG: sigma-70 family RNA polymerase sigma factor [Acidobacteriota bacterium]